MSAFATRDHIGLLLILVITLVLVCLILVITLTLLDTCDHLRALSYNSMLGVRQSGS